MKRNRIVINLDQLPRGARGGGSRRGLSRVLLFIAIILLVVVGGVAAGGYFWWRHYQTTPAYSLALLVDAAQRNDSATVDGILDSDQIAADFIQQVRQRLPASSTAASLLASQGDAGKDSLAAKLKDSLHNQLMKELQQLTSAAQGKPFIVIAVAIPYFADIKQENNTAQVTANVKDEQIKVKMQGDNSRWRVTAVQDDKLAKMAADSIMQNLPSNGSQVQDSIRKQIEGLKW